MSIYLDIVNLKTTYPYFGTLSISQIYNELGQNINYIIWDNLFCMDASIFNGLFRQKPTQKQIMEKLIEYLIIII